MVPHLTTALNGPLLELEQRVIDACTAIERWFRLRWLAHEPPFYCSVDVRIGSLNPDIAAAARGLGDAPPNRFYAYGLVARLALAAAGLELERSAPAE